MDSGYCYITSLKYGKVKIPAAKLIPGEEYILLDSSYLFKNMERLHWIKIDDIDTFDRFEVFRQTYTEGIVI